MEEFQDSHKELIQKRQSIYSEIYELKKYLEELKQKVELTEIDIQRNCIKHNKDHEWEVEREEGPYGERFFVCKHCNTIN